MVESGVKCFSTLKLWCMHIAVQLTVGIPKSLHLNPLSCPGNLTKSNSEDLRSSLVSALELCSNKSLCQESDIPLIH